MSTIHQHINQVLRWFVLTVLFLICDTVEAQLINGYSIKDGKMLIMLDRRSNEKELSDFIEQFDLKGIGLWQLFKNNKHDSLEKEGWQISVQNEVGFIINKTLEGLDNLENPVNKILYTQKENDISGRFPAVSNRWTFGYNRFKNKSPFTEVKDSVVQFFLRGYQKAQEVTLPGSFNNWSPTAQPMKRTDSGWIAYIKLAPGKYWYKFVADGNWIVDGDNELKENDGQGNTNSVYFKTNTLFSLNGFANAKNVFLSGSFNNWKTKELRMTKTATGWQLPLYLANGTHVYKFIVDGKWVEDDNNLLKVPDGAGGFNSMLSIGNPLVFHLAGYENAKQVFVAGSFNNWRDFELPMTRTRDGWELPYVIGPGNYEYKFIVDGKWISDPGNPLKAEKDGNSFLIVQPNYTFRLKDFGNAKEVFLAGDFNGWNPEAFPMKKQGEDWVFDIHLPIGKTRYKLVVDGKWMLDPGNKLWEQNEWGTGNSIIWVDNKLP